jgi:predicted nucleotidyltransferase
MPLPEFNTQGDLPPGVHQAGLSEIVARFGGGSAARKAASASLVRIHDVAKATGKLNRLVIFGSYVTSKPDPNDVDVVLVMADDFKWNDCTGETRDLFDHQRAAREFAASVFWVRPSAILLGTLQEFIAHWQVKRDKTTRGIVEVTS